MRQPLLDPESGYEQLPGSEEFWGNGHGSDSGSASPELLESGEVEWGAIPNLDLFFSRVYRYYEEKGFWVMVTAQMLNLAALGFTAAFSGFLLLWVDWGALHAQCLVDDTCDILDVAILRHPLQHGAPLWSAARVAYLALLGAYWLWNLAHLAVDLKALVEVRHFCNVRLGLSERAIQTVTWPDVARRIVEVQRRLRLCVKRDMTEHDIVSRIMRKDNYLIGMLNKGVLALNVPLPGARTFMLTRTLEWNLRWGLLDAMFDEATFCIRPEFLSHPGKLARRFRRMAWANLALAPFVFVFLAIHGFLRNAEAIYHHPSCVGARRWSPLARWRMREFNELPHYIDHRLSASHKAAEDYIGQFPSPLLSHVARFVAFIAGSFAALALGAALVDDQLLERRFADRTLVWWAATLGVVLAVSRAFIVDEAEAAFHPELAMLEVVAHTHHMPRHWRGRAHTREVQSAFMELFPFRAVVALEEMLSILLTPFLLYFSLPACADAIVAFVRDNTVRVEGLGDVCSMAAFDLARHGNPRYGSPFNCAKELRSRQGKMEKSLLSFATTYPGWEPDAAARQLLGTLRSPAAGGGQGLAPAEYSLDHGVLPPGISFAAGRLRPSPWRHLQSIATTASTAADAHLLQQQAQQAYQQYQPPQQAYQQYQHGNSARQRRSIFASVELPSAAASAVLPAAAASASLALPAAAASASRPHGQPAGGASWMAAAAVAQASAVDVEDRVAASQILLQSFYEEQDAGDSQPDATPTPHPTQWSAASSAARDAGSSGGGSFGGGAPPARVWQRPQISQEVAASRLRAQPWGRGSGSGSLPSPLEAASYASVGSAADHDGPSGEVMPPIAPSASGTPDLVAPPPFGDTGSSHRGPAAAQGMSDPNGPLPFGDMGSHHLGTAAAATRGSHADAAAARGPGPAGLRSAMQPTEHPSAEIASADSSAELLPPPASDALPQQGPTSGQQQQQQQQGQQQQWGQQQQQLPASGGRRRWAASPRGAPPHRQLSDTEMAYLGTSGSPHSPGPLS